MSLKTGYDLQSVTNVTVQDAIKVETVLVGVDLLLQQPDLALCLDNLDVGVAGVIQSQPSAVIPTILQSLQPFQQQL